MRPSVAKLPGVQEIRLVAEQQFDSSFKDVADRFSDMFDHAVRRFAPRDDVDVRLQLAVICRHRNALQRDRPFDDGTLTAWHHRSWRRCDRRRERRDVRLQCDGKPMQRSE